MLDLLNDNAGAVQAVATVVLVLATIWYVRLTRGMLNETRKAQRPYVYIDLAADRPGLLNLGVGNSGDRAAEDLRFRVQTDLVDGLGKQPLSEAQPFANGIAYLPPHRRYGYDVLIDDAALDGAPGEHTFEVTMTYRYGDRTFTDKIVVDMASFQGVRFSSFAQPGADTAAAVDRLRQSLKPPAAIVGFPVLKACPVCGEAIQSSARKCPRCAEWIEQESTSQD